MTPPNSNSMQILFLEEWLRSCPLNPHNPPVPSGTASSSARDIIQAWSQLRTCLQHNNTFQPHHLQSLDTLKRSQTSLHVADPQAKLLLSLISLPQHPDVNKPSFYALLFRILYIWVRKSPNPSPSLLQSTVSALRDLLSTDVDNKLFVSETILLLGAASSIPNLPESSREVCLQLLYGLLKEEYQATGLQGLVPEALACIGYALLCSKTINFDRFVAFLLGIWSMRDGPCACVPHGLMILHLMEWLVSGFINSQSWEKIEWVVKAVSNSNTQKGNHMLGSQFGAVMAAAGILRALNRYGNGLSGSRQFRNLAEDTIDFVARGLISETGKVYVPGNQDFDRGDSGGNLLLQCIALGLARCGPISYRAPVLMCLVLALLIEIFPLPCFYRRAIENPHGNYNVLELGEVREHVGNILFKEAGAATRALCNQYVLADQELKLFVENSVWSYSREIYSKHRLVALAFRGMKELLEELEKIAEAVFLMVVVFASTATRHKIKEEFSLETQTDISVRTLVAFSCIEYFRRVRLPDFTDTVRRIVLHIQKNGSACASLVDSIPPYSELTNQEVPSYIEKVKYLWYEDEVKTARILFYWRVLATCMDHVPGLLFRKLVVPTMFLYMIHPAEKVARASHSVFVAFISSGKDLHEDNIASLKEQLVFYYMQRSLEAYPGITPFDGVVAGVIALVRHLPAGSPAIFYCIHSLIEKCNSLFCKAIIQNADLWGKRQEEPEPWRKVMELLLRLIHLVDIQVLPSLLKLLAQLIVQLPNRGQNAVLNEIHSQVAESDDVTKKPILVSWLQSVSYICSQNSQHICSSSTTRGSEEESDVSSCHTTTFNLNRTWSRL